MTAKSTSSGICALCSQRISKAKMLTHLESCIPPDGSEASILIRFDAQGDRRYWIILAARQGASLRQVDALLRSRWLECCGHMSAFAADHHEVPMGRDVAGVFRPGARVSYEYDFGTPTRLIGQYLGHGPDVPGRSVVRVLAQNAPLVWDCPLCAAPATLVCPFCFETTAVFCAMHAATHEHAGEEAYLPVVNSPRMGVCGYTG